MANEISSSITHVQLDVHQFKYFVDDCFIGDIFLDMNGQVGFHSFPRGKWTPWHGCWLPVSDFRAFRIEFDPYATDESARVYTWTYVHMRVNASITETWYGIDSDGRNIRMEWLYDLCRRPDGSYQSLYRLDSIYC